MDALRASYGDSSSDPEDEEVYQGSTEKREEEATFALPPPPLSLLSPPNPLGALGGSQERQVNRVRSFPHVEGNYALHVYIPVYIPSGPRKETAQFLKNIVLRVPGLHVVDADVPLDILCKDEQRFDQIALGREFHISLGRTVPIRVHQIDSIVTMLRQRLQFQKRYWIDFNKWEVFMNDERTRSFLCLEIIRGGLAEITKHIQAVNEVYRLHNLPEFYQDPRPHVSVAWASGDVSTSMKRAVEDELKGFITESSIQSRIFSCKFCGIECKIGKKTYKICKVLDE